MKIKFVGKPVKITKKECREAIKFYTSLLMSPRVAKNLDLEVTFTPKFYKLTKNIAEAYYEEYDPDIPKLFTIEIDDELGRPSLLKALAHEMVHVKQYRTGELKDLVRRANRVNYKGEVVDTKETNYYDQPFEIEAYGREVGLYRRYIKHVKKQKRIRSQVNQG